MRRLLLILILLVTTSTSAWAVKFPENVKTAIKKDFAKADFRFDGVILLPDGTIYLPLFPALVKKPDVIEVKQTFPANMKLSQQPDIVIFNNDFALMKVLYDVKGNKTVLKLDSPPVEIKTGLLPQDMLVPKGLQIPENIKGVIGNLQIATSIDAGVKIKSEMAKPQEKVKTFIKPAPSVALLKDRVMYVATCYSKNIHVINGEQKSPEYALSLKSIPIDIKLTPDEKFLMVTSFGNHSLDIISLADDQVIKSLDLKNQPTEIVVNKKAQKAYVAVPADSSIYLIDIATMALKQQIKINGYCERLALSDDGRILFYFDKKTSDIIAVELTNDFVIKNIGKFPNVSKLALTQNKLYIISRTKNKLAIIDYATLGVSSELDLDKKPIDMLVYGDNLFILCAHNNIIQVLNTETDEITNTIKLNTDGFSTVISRVKETNIAVIGDTQVPKYVVIDLDKKQVLKTYPIDVPVSTIIIADKVRKINK